MNKPGNPIKETQETNKYIYLFEKQQVSTTEIEGISRIQFQTAENNCGTQFKEIIQKIKKELSVDQIQQLTHLLLQDFSKI
ncbi:hypothetical protein M0811_09088 [Anaeramoeba ignava]|uniref:Uncharacterized protein n=1 Tax=Anaeramoeba ignava TaxID=1746090 RepID=A0A9Q0LKL6_ANAIG|nr:hypothetical protein M0811_09088 [Anaeramoeba ignava]